MRNCSAAASRPPAARPPPPGPPAQPARPARVPAARAVRSTRPARAARPGIILLGPPAPAAPGRPARAARPGIVLRAPAAQAARAALRRASRARPTSKALPRERKPRFGGAFFWDNDRVNADPAELEKFSQLAHRWWDPQGEFRPLHDINPLRLGWIDERAALAGKRVLDVGCGGGILAEAMAARGAAVTGIDLSEKSLRVAELHRLQTQANVVYESASAEEYAAEHASAFDVITCMELLEHVPEPAAMVAACARLVRC